MRHNRKAVMTEQYRLYLKKTIFNGKYFVRNLQIVACLILMVGIVAGIIALGVSKKDDKVTTGAEVNVKDALFGTEEIESAVITQGITDNVENVISKETDETSEEPDTTELVVAEQAITEVSSEEEVVIEKETAEPEEPAGEFDKKCIANVEETLNIRKEADSSSDFVGSMNPGAIAIVEGREGNWTKIKSGDVEGYVLSEYILTGKIAEQFAEDYGVLQGTVLDDGVNIRAEKSTESDILQIVNKDDKLNIIKEDVTDEADTEKAVDEPAKTEEDTTAGAVLNEDNEITWLSVQLTDGKIGYVSAELVDVEKLYEIAVSAEELKRRAEEEARLAAEKEAARVAQAQAQQKLDQESDNYKGATTTPIKAAESGDCLGTFKLTAYCGCKKCCNSSKTATGTTCTEGRTIAVDPSVIPYGSKVVINGIVYTAEDCGGAIKGNVIDIYFATHKKAISFGVQYAKVYKY